MSTVRPHRSRSSPAPVAVPVPVSPTRWEVTAAMSTSPAAAMLDQLRRSGHDRADCCAGDHQPADKGIAVAVSTTATTNRCRPSSHASHTSAAASTSW